MSLATSNKFVAYSLKGDKSGPNGEKFVVLRPSGFIQSYHKEGAAAAQSAKRENEKAGL